MILESDFLDKYCIKKYSVEKRFESKKNHVYLIKTVTDRGMYQHYVVKEYMNHSRMDKEIGMLQGLCERGIQVPKLYYRNSEYVVIEYLEGKLLLDALFGSNSGEYLSIPGIADKADAVLYELCRWLKGFYKAAQSIHGTGMILGDVNFRNFIFKDAIYGIDFEECSEGIIERDAGRICAYALTYTPAFTDWKMGIAKRLFKMLLEELGLRWELVLMEAESELSSIEKRRKLNIPPGILKNIAM